MTPNIEWEAQSSLAPSVFSNFSQILSQVHTGWNFESINEKVVASDKELLAYVKKYNFGESYLTDILALPMSGCRQKRSDGDDYIVISYVIEGNDYNLDFDGRHYQLKRGNVFIWNTTQAIYFRSSEMVRQLSVFVPFNSCFNLGKLISKETIFLLDKGEAISNILRSTILTLRRNAHKISASDEPFIINPIVELAKAGVAKNQFLYIDKKRNREKTLDEVMAYVWNNLFDYDLSVTSISHALGVSNRYIHHIFSEEECSLSNWISKQRLAQAEKYLRDRKYQAISITDIAMMTGFNDSSYFSRQFKNRFGSSPREYRHNHQLNNSTSQ